ncbi:MAG: hypothetical protein ACPLKP_00215 [Microgenomates group bacterium]
MNKKGKLNILLILTLGITFLSFTAIIFLVILFNISSAQYLKQLKKQEPQLPNQETVKPSEVLNKKSFYSGKKIILRGKVIQESVVCEKKECPNDDPCCGCPSERDLLIIDSDALLTSKTKEALKLLGKDSESFCQREKGSCRYLCSGWNSGALYDVYGEFWAEAPPPGWNKSLEYYFTVEGKNLVKTQNFGERVNVLIEEVKGIFKNLRTSGYYVLP